MLQFVVPGFFAHVESDAACAMARQHNLLSINDESVQCLFNWQSPQVFAVSVTVTTVMVADLLVVAVA